MAETRPDIAVVIAAYNVERYIHRAIRSALDQASVAVEVILVDDGSSDRTVPIAAAIQDQRLKILSLEGNSGPSMARNIGIAAATAPWVAILDGDDAFAPDRLQRLLALATAKQADIIVDNLQIRREADGATYPMFPPSRFVLSGLLDLPRFIKGNRFLFGSRSLGYLKPVFNRAFLQRHQLGYDPAIRIGEDYILLAEALACDARCAIDGAAGYLYTVRAGSISHRLTQADVGLIIAADRRFLSRRRLGPAAARAQGWRSLALREMHAFTGLIHALKQKKIGPVLGIVLTRPTVILHLWRPLTAQLKRWLAFSKRSPG